MSGAKRLRILGALFKKGIGDKSEVFNDGDPGSVIGDYGHAEGYRTKVTGDRGHAEGDNTEAGWRSHAEGFYTLANNTSHAGGRLSKATGKGSFANGVETYTPLTNTAGGYIWITDNVSIDDVTIPVEPSVNGILNIGDFINFAHDNGVETPTDCRQVVGISDDGKTIAIDYPLGDANWTAELQAYMWYVRVAVGCEASGDGATALGHSAKARGVSAFSAGAYTEADGNYGGAFGYKTKAKGTSSMSHGCESEAPGNYSRAGGYKCKASGSRAVAEGNETESTGVAAFTSGNQTKAKADYSRAGGSYCEATGLSSVAEGNRAVASGEVSKATGNKTTASGSYSDAQNMMTTAASYCQSARGRNNIPDSDGKYIEIVGNSKTDTPSNAYTLDWSGNARFAGKVYVNCTGESTGSILVTMGEVLKLLSASNLASILQPTLVATGTVRISSDSYITFGLTSSKTPGSNFYMQRDKNYRIVFRTNTCTTVTYLNTTGSPTMSFTSTAVGISGKFAILQYDITSEASIPTITVLFAEAVAESVSSGFQSLEVYELPF